MKRISMMLGASLACAVGFAGPMSAAPSAEDALPAVSAEAPPTRASDQPNALLLALKENDFAALLAASDYNEDLVEIARRWDEQADGRRLIQEQTVEKLAAGDAAVMSDDPMQQAWLKLQSAEGVDLLVAEWQPKIAEEVGDSLMKFNLGFGATLIAIANDKDLNAIEMQQLTQLMYAVQNWTGRVDFADAERLRRALQAVSRLVRQTGLKRFEDTRTLHFEDAVVHGDALIATVKEVLAVYDIPVEEILNSVRISEVDAYEDKATLHMEARVLGVNLSTDTRMQYHNGDWVDVRVVEMLNSHPESGGNPDNESADLEALIDTPATAPSPADPGSPSYSCAPEGKLDAGVEVEAAAE